MSRNLNVRIVQIKNKEHRVYTDIIIQKLENGVFMARKQQMPFTSYGTIISLESYKNNITETNYQKIESITTEIVMMLRDKEYPQIEIGIQGPADLSEGFGLTDVDEKAQAKVQSLLEIIEDYFNDEISKDSVRTMGKKNSFLGLFRAKSSKKF